MIEIIIPLLLALALSGLVLMGWRSLRGPARNRVYLALRVAVTIIAAMALVTMSVWRLTKSRAVQLFGGMVAHVETSELVVALTFDDGPLEGHTEQILQLLEAEGVRATFFLTGGQLAENPAEGERIAAAGHEIGNHSYSHRQMIGMSYRTVRDEIERTDELIRATGYEGPILFRPPFGKRFIVLPYYLRVNDRRTVYWDVEPESYGEIARDSDLIEAHVLDQAGPGSIILLHVMGATREATVQAVPGIIEGLSEQGYQFVTVSELLGYAR